MAVYLRIDGLDDDSDEVTDEDVREAANSAFVDLRLQGYDVDGVVPVFRPERDPCVLETAAVYAHREETADSAVADAVYCTFDRPVEGLDHPAQGSVTEWVETQFYHEFDGDDEALDRILPSEHVREQHGRDPVRAGTLYYDGTSGRVVRVGFDAFDDRLVVCDDCGRRGLRERIEDHACPEDSYRGGVVYGSLGP